MKKFFENLTPKIISLLIAALGLLIVSVSIAAYFLYVLPKQQEEKLNFERQKYEDEQAEKEEIKRAEEEKTLDEKRAQEEQRINLESCLLDTNITYRTNWTEYCKIWKLEVKDTYEDCKKRFSYMTDQEAKDWCWPNTPDYNEDDSGSCFLPSKYSDTVEKIQKDAKDECYRKYPL